MPKITGYTYTTEWEKSYDEEMDEVVKAQAARTAAIAAGTEPKTWQISGEGDEWPREAWFHEEGVRS